MWVDAAKYAPTTPLSSCSCKVNSSKKQERKKNPTQKENKREFSFVYYESKKKLLEEFYKQRDTEN